MKGFEDSAPEVVGRQDARSLAPEITTTASLKQNGKAFIEFMEGYLNTKKEVGKGKSYFHPSESLDKVMEDSPEPMFDGLDEYAYEVIAINRNDFIGKSP
jgi:hypothetical protein